MDAEHTVVCRLVLNNCTKWEPLKQIVHLLEDTAWVFDVLTQTLGTLLTETQIFVDFSILMVASQQENLLRVL